MRREAALAFFATLAASACNTPAPPREAHESTVTPVAPRSASPPSATVPPASTAPPASSGACATDEDCRTFSSYCAEAPCACRVLSARDPAPKCLGAAASNVRCFADPCMNKTARCQGGACVLTAK